MIACFPYRLALLASVSIAVAMSAALAQPVVPLPPGDPASIITVQIENDSVARTDRNYTSGISLGCTSPSVDAAGKKYLPN